MTTRDRLLDAAADVLLDAGADQLTLAAVAERAGVSKGGLFYHFPSKQALVAGLVERLTHRFDAAVTTAGDEPGAATLAYLDSTVPAEPPGRNAGAGAAEDRVTAAVLAGLVVDPNALVPLRTAYLRWQRRLADDGIDPAVAVAVRLAVDGWWLARLLDLAPPGDDLHGRVRAVLTNLIDTGSGAPR